MTDRQATAGAGVVLGVLGAVAVWNAFTYPSIGGYDAQEYITYARDLVTRGTLPDEGVYHTPPGFPAVAGAATELGRFFGLSDPEHLGQLVGALSVVGSGVIVLLLARVLWPARPVLWLAAVGFFAAFPTVLKTGAMFHPESLGMLVTAGALLVLARMVRGTSYAWPQALGLGVLLGLGQLVRGWSVWMVGVAVVVLGVVAVTDRTLRRPVVVALALAVSVAALIPAPWYAYQAAKHAAPVFNRSQPDEFLLGRRPVEFYLDGRVPEVFRRPWAGQFDDRFWPVLYAETWGDYFGIWAWGPGRGDRTDTIDTTLARRSLLGIVPSVLAATGLIALLGIALTRPREDAGRLIAALPPVAAVASILYLSVAYPSSDGDTIKGTYALAAVPSLALCFGFAVEHLARSRLVGIALGVVLVLTALALLPFVVW